ncbi:MAG: hypothetical protein ACHQ50_06900 [Fimbriimonadales bacterium]
MKTKLIPIIVATALMGSAHAQVGGIRFSAGYGWSGSIPNTTTGSSHLLGPELIAELPAAHMTQVEFDFRADVLLGGQLARGSDLDGTVYRFLLIARTSVPGSKVSTFGGIGWGTAQARAGEFAGFSGMVNQIGLSFPLGIGSSGLAPTVELASSIASRSGLSGYSLTIGLHF